MIVIDDLKTEVVALVLVIVIQSQCRGNSNSEVGPERCFSIEGKCFGQKGVDLLILFLTNL